MFGGQFYGEATLKNILSVVYGKFWVSNPYNYVRLVSYVIISMIPTSPLWLKIFVFRHLMYWGFFKYLRHLIEILNWLYLEQYLNSCIVFYFCFDRKRNFGAQRVAFTYFIDVKEIMSWTPVSTIVLVVNGGWFLNIYNDALINNQAETS